MDLKRNGHDIIIGERDLAILDLFYILLLFFLVEHDFNVAPCPILKVPCIHINKFRDETTRQKGIFERSEMIKKVLIGQINFERETV